jgi:hypothetical protein
MNSIDLPPAVSMARLPETYTRAKLALQACVSIDECKDWADKVEAMASYARQSGDVELRRMADRIQARAIDRCGALIKQIPKGSGGAKKSGSQLSLSDRDLARIAAGLSRHQAKTAVSVSNVPRARFEREVEGDNPPSVTKLAEMGRQKRQAPKPEARTATAEEKAASAKLLRTVSAFISETRGIKIDAALNGCSADESLQLMKEVRDAQGWLAILVIKQKAHTTKSAKRSQTNSTI